MIVAAPSGASILMTRQFLIAFLGLLALAAASAQTPSNWKIHDMERPRPREVTATPALQQPPPSDAIVLFDGSSLDEWASARGGEPGWAVRDGFMEAVPGKGAIETKRSFGDVQLHVEFAMPDPPEGVGQGRGNSGVKLMRRYEVQVLDSYKDHTYADGQAGAIYGQSPPLVNASRPPGEWQAFDIFFRRPRFRPDGSLLKAARITVLHNGVLIQDNHELWGPTQWLQYRDWGVHEDRLPLSLQDHANPVRFRNIWLRELDETTRPGPPEPPAYEVTHLAPEVLDRYVGKYEGIEGSRVDFELAREGERIYLKGGGRMLDIVTTSTTEFRMRWADARLAFTLGSDGAPTKMEFYVGRSRFPTAKAK